MNNFTPSKFFQIIVNCEWSLWRKDGDCSVTCGIGTQNLIRSKIKEEENGGYCENKTVMTERCKLPPCPGKYCKNCRNW